MSQAPLSGGMVQPLSIGNVVNAGFRLYRSHLKLYFLIALRAYAFMVVWGLLPLGVIAAILVPNNPSPATIGMLVLVGIPLAIILLVYGSMKFAVNAAQISRLAFGDLVEQPEPPRAVSRQMNARKWRFFWLGLLMYCISMAAIAALVLIFLALFSITAVAIAAISGIDFQTLNADPTAAIIAFVLLILGGIVCLVIASVPITWFLMRLVIADIPLAIEENISASTSINRSWILTQGNIIRLLLISLVAFAVTLPIQVAIQTTSQFLQLIFTIMVPSLENPTAAIAPIAALFFLIIFALSILGNAAILPFWQVIKAAMYYDLRSRREGMGLQLRDRTI